MIPTAFTDRAAAWLIAALMTFFGDVAMASSLRLADPAELAGHWQLSQPAAPSKTCTLDLERNGTLGAGAECLSGWIGESAIGWFPEPDGIAVTGKEGSKIIFLSRQKEGLYQGTLKSGSLVILQRAP